MILFYEFLTIWSLLFHILDITYNVVLINTYILSFVISLLGLYITYYVKELNIGNVKFKGAPLVIIDLLFHQLPFMYLLMNHNFYKTRYSIQQTCFTIVFICVYYILIDIYRVYRFDKKKTKYIFLLTVISAVLFVYKSSILKE